MEIFKRSSGKALSLKKRPSTWPKRWMVMLLHGKIKQSRPTQYARLQENPRNKCQKFHHASSASNGKYLKERYFRLDFFSQVTFLTFRVDLIS